MFSVNEKKFNEFAEKFVQANKGVLDHLLGRDILKIIDSPAIADITVTRDTRDAYSPITDGIGIIKDDLIIHFYFYETMVGGLVYFMVKRDFIEQCADNCPPKMQPFYEQFNDPSKGDSDADYVILLTMDFTIDKDLKYTVKPQSRFGKFTEFGWPHYCRENQSVTLPDAFRRLFVIMPQLIFFQYKYDDHHDRIDLRTDFSLTTDGERVLVSYAGKGSFVDY